MLRSICLILVAAVLFPVTMTAQEQKPIPGDVLRDGTLSFFGRASLGNFVGSTTMVSGAIVGGRDNSETRGWVEAPVATLDSKNARRDRDLRATMEVDKYPTMRFELDRASIVRVASGSADSTIVVLHGTLTLHGVTKRVDVPGTVNVSDDVVHVSSTFPLDVRDYRVGGLKKLFGLLRMDPEINVTVDLHFTRAASTATTGR